MFVRVPKHGAAFVGTRPNISESHSEISARVPFCIVAGRPKPFDGRTELPPAVGGSMRRVPGVAGGQAGAVLGAGERGARRSEPGLCTAAK